MQSTCCYLGIRSSLGRAGGWTCRDQVRRRRGLGGRHDTCTISLLLPPLLVCFTTTALLCHPWFPACFVDPKVMYDSLQRLAALPDELAVYPGHGYSGSETTIGREKAGGYLNPGISREHWNAHMAK